MSERDQQSPSASSTERTRYIRMRPKSGGAWCVCDPSEVDDIRDGAPEEEYEAEEVWMTDAEYEALGEFDGW